MTSRKFVSSFCIAVTFLVLMSSSAFAARKGDFFSVAGGQLLGFIAAIDMLLMAVAVHKIYHRIFSVFYFSFKAIFIELFWIFIIGGSLVMAVPSFLEELGLWNAVTGYVYFVAIFLLMTGLAKKFWKAKKDE